MNSVRRSPSRRRDNLAARVPRRPHPSVRARVRAMRERFVFNREMRLRLMSAVVLVPLVLFSTWFGEYSFLFIVLLTAALLLLEWLRMIGASHLIHLHVVGWAMLAVIALCAHALPVWPSVAVVFGAAVVSGVAAWGDRSDIAVRWVAAGTLYSGLAMVSLIALRKGDDGFGAVVFVLLIAWASDTAAFFVGRQLGGPKLWPRVSPAKTWSGAIGGLVAGVAFGAAVAFWLSVPITLAALFLAAAVAIAAQLGDLAESAAKRHFMVKDAGTIIPGHGGVMDRVDGVVAAAFLSAALGAFMAGDAPASGLLRFMGAQ